ncbi:type II secretion system protein GspC [Maricurvus nonylphenolicus]|uniref:type II secretion system protein GspC n=1 Tax=Maricurvus nonylphenolicus TaxID=1008307 RepID=UPI0036F2E822
MSTTRTRQNAKCEVGQARGETDVSVDLRSALASCTASAVYGLQLIPVFFWQFLITSIVSIVLSFYFSRLFWLLFNPGISVPDFRQTAAPANLTLLESITTEASNPLGSSHVSLQALVHLQGLQLFSQHSEKIASVKPVLPAVEDKAVDTKLHLLLNGVIASTQQNGARAIIASGNHQSLYAPGDLLPVSATSDAKTIRAGEAKMSVGDVRVVKILPGRVILDNRGVYESLWLYQDETKVVANLKTPVVVPAGSQAVSDQVVSDIAAGDITLDRLIKFSMARQAGEVIGYKIRPGQERKLFERLGLQANDIVVAVNGLSLDSSAKAMQVYRDLRGTRSATLDILRGGKPLNLSIDLQQLEG